MQGRATFQVAAQLCTPRSVAVHKSKGPDIMDDGSVPCPAYAASAIHPLNRRTFLHGSALFMAGVAADGAGAPPVSGTQSVSQTRPAGTTQPAHGKCVLRIGLISDPHYADRSPKINRYYRESIAKIRESVKQFNKVGIDFAVELGDLIDAADSVEDEIAHLKAIDAEYAKLKADRYYVLGNHCVWNLTKQEFIANTAAKKAHYSFDKGGFHFVVLDACFRKDGEPYGRQNFDWTDAHILQSQRDWLEQDLRQTSLRTIVFVHHRLDVADKYGISNAAEVRKILEDSGKVLAVFQGHYHPGDYKRINDIHYCTLKALVEGSGKASNAYGILEVYKDGSLRLDGFRRQCDYALSVSE